jgi:hypothetical protein
MVFGVWCLVFGVWLLVFSAAHREALAELETKH